MWSFIKIWRTETFLSEFKCNYCGIYISRIFLVLILLEFSEQVQCTRNTSIFISLLRLTAHFNYFSLVHADSWWNSKFMNLLVRTRTQIIRQGKICSTKISSKDRIRNLNFYFLVFWKKLFQLKYSGNYISYFI